MFLKSSHNCVNTPVLSCPPEMCADVTGGILAYLEYIIELEYALSESYKMHSSVNI